MKYIMEDDLVGYRTRKTNSGIKCTNYFANSMRNQGLVVALYSLEKAQMVL